MGPKAPREAELRPASELDGVWKDDDNDMTEIAHDTIYLQIDHGTCLFTHLECSQDSNFVIPKFTTKVH